MLIPTVLALSEFFSSNFPNISWYPYWYLGNPYHFLIGPVVPIALAIVQNSIPDLVGDKVQSYDLYLGLILLSIVLGGIGIYFLLRNWRVGKLQAIISGVLYIVLPAGFFLLNFQNGLNHIAFGFLPLVLLLFKKFLVKENKFIIIFLTLGITIMLLTSISIFLPLVIGFIALFVSIEHKDYSHEKIGKTILILLLSLYLSTLWYTPKFWWVTIANPSVGGVPLGKLIWSIFQFLIQFLPLALAIALIKFRRYKFQGSFLFGILFFTTFLFLSILRFVSDPDFVMDWIGFSIELQFGSAILLGGLLAKLIKQLDIKNQKSKIKNTYQRLKIISVIFGFILLLMIDILIMSKFFRENKLNDYQSSIGSIIKKNVKENERVFLSGSSVFFINSKLNIQQVRGGVDQSSIHPFWAHGAYQIREGTSASLTYDWLRALGISYVLVHGKDSREPFRDFKYPLKFADSLSSFTLISAEMGNRLYRVNNSSIGRVADTSILNVRKPKNGADKQSINNYILSFKRPFEVDNQKPNEITFEGNIKQGEVVSLAISYDSLWRIVNGKGVIKADPLGNMVIIPNNTGLQKYILVYTRNTMDLVIPMGLGIVIVIILIKYQKIVPYVRKRFPKLHVGLKDEDY